MTNPSEAAGEVGASDQGIHSESANGKQFDTYDYDIYHDKN